MIPIWTFFLTIGIFLIYIGRRDLKKSKNEGSYSSFGYSTNISLIVLGIVFLIGAFIKIIGT